MQINKAEVFSRYYAWEKAFNESQVDVNGIPVLKDRIRHNIGRTITALLHKYVEHFRTAVKTPEFADSDIMPSFYTNRKELALLANCGERTVYDHVMKLIGVGVLCKKLHGRQNDFELWISPWIVTGYGEKPSVLKFEKALKNEDIAPKIQSSPPISPRTPNNKIITIAVENVDKTSIQHLLKGELSGFAQTREQDEDITRTRENSSKNDKTPTLAENKLEQNCAGGAGPEIPTIIYPPQVAKDCITKEEYLKYITNFWLYTRKVLYSHFTFTPEKERQVKNLIYSSVFGSFDGNIPKNKVSYFYHQFIQRVDMAKNFVDKHPERYIPHPEKYFDTHFDGGFRKTEQWLIKKNNLKAQTLAESELLKARKSIQSGIAPKGLKDGKNYSPFQLYQHWENRLSKLSNPKIMASFYAFCSKEAVNPIKTSKRNVLK